MNTYSFINDLSLVKELLGITYGEIADSLGVTSITLSRWKTGESSPSKDSLASFYEMAFKKGLRLNAIKAQLHKESVSPKSDVLLFHGAKNQIEGHLSLSYSHTENDFGSGFYCGESLEQSAMFVAGYPHSSIYILEFNPCNLKSLTYHVDRDWMLTIAWFRGRLNNYAESPVLKQLIGKLNDMDYLIAPIADNRMFEILNNFIDGEITDIQCQHCLSATNLGSQYVLRSPNALKNAHIKERCFLSNAEKEYYADARKAETSIGADKVKIARRQFRGQGQYIDEVLA